MPDIKENPSRCKPVRLFEDRLATDNCTPGLSVIAVSDDVAWRQKRKDLRELGWWLSDMHHERKASFLCNAFGNSDRCHSPVSNNCATRPYLNPAQDVPV